MTDLHAQLFNFWTRIISSIGLVPLLLSSLAVCIAWKQSKTSQEKLRLDRYEKRSEIYVRTLDYCNQLLRWEGTPEQDKLIDPFYRAFRESKFLFPKSSGVYRCLEEFSEHALVITRFKMTIEIYKESSDEQSLKVLKMFDDSRKWIREFIPNFETRFAPFLNLHAV